MAAICAIDARAWRGVERGETPSKAGFAGLAASCRNVGRRILAPLAGFPGIARMPTVGEAGLDGDRSGRLVCSTGSKS